MVAPSGEQFEITADGYRAVITECGAGLRVLECDGVPIVAGYAEDTTATAGRGQLLVPWPNRIAAGSYTFAGRTLQLPLNEPARDPDSRGSHGNAIHGLGRWTSWTPEKKRPDSVSLTCRLMAQPGYPWTLDLLVRYQLSAGGLAVTLSARNLSDSPAPYAHGAHPYLAVGPGPVDSWELLLPASTRLTTDESQIPSGGEPVEDTDYDFRAARPIGDLRLDDAFTDLTPDADGDRVTVQVREPTSGQGAALWMDVRHRWVQVFTGDGLPGARTALAVEPMTAPADAFNSGDGLVVLAPAGTAGDEHSASWGIRSL